MASIPVRPCYHSQMLSSLRCELGKAKEEEKLLQKKVNTLCNQIDEIENFLSEQEEHISDEVYVINQYNTSNLRTERDELYNQMMEKVDKMNRIVVCIEESYGCLCLTKEWEIAFKKFEINKLRPWIYSGFLQPYTVVSQFEQNIKMNYLISEYAVDNH